MSPVTKSTVLWYLEKHGWDEEKAMEAMQQDFPELRNPTHFHVNTIASTLKEVKKNAALRKGYSG